MTRLMDAFPPAPEAQVTLANWRTAPYNRWAFHHVRELIPTAEIAHDPAHVLPLPAAPAPLFDEGFLANTDTDGIVVVHRGRLVFERYFNGMRAESPHILMSVSKSLLGLVAGRLPLDVERPVTALIPELAGTAYRGATIRHLLDMRAGVAFAEDYLATSGPMLEYRKATAWNPSEGASDLRSFYRHLTQPDGAHGGRFHYVSPNTDLLGWVIERATGQRFADLAAELLWKPIGAEWSGYITLDRLGAPRCAGGVCVTVRDLARVGLWICRRDDPWLDDLEGGGDPQAWDAGSFVPYYPGLAMHYRSQWYTLRGPRPLLFGMGIHGQNLFVDRRNDLVIAKVSSQAQPLDAGRMALTMGTVAEVRQELAPA
ncbi:MAG TPA: serine hydrolase domain-containing protein [Gemmatimonadales bacterium]|nr:serine hydrolase domain-containing protein [Gemmatimonadales bacterium]